MHGSWSVGLLFGDGDYCELEEPDIPYITVEQEPMIFRFSVSTCWPSQILYMLNKPIFGGIQERVLTTKTIEALECLHNIQFLPH